MIQDEITKKAYDFIKSNLINVIVVLTSLVYIFYSVVVLEPTDLSVWDVILKSLFGIAFGFAIKQLLGESGLNKGHASLIWQNNLEKYRESCNLANDYIERVDNFYYHEEMDKKRNLRRTYLMGYKLRYEWFFDEKGNYIGKQEKRSTNGLKQRIELNRTYIINGESKLLTRKQNQCLKKCIKLKIYNLNLFSEYTTEMSADTKREKTDLDQRAKLFRKNAIAAILTAVMGVYFLPSLTNFNWGKVIVSIFQVCMWVSCGIMQLYSNYNYVVIEKVNKLTRKKELIVKFVRGCENGLYKNNPYEDGGEQ